MIHHRTTTALDYAAALVMALSFIGFYFTKSLAWLGVLSLATAVKVLQRPVWYLINRRAIKQQSEVYEATVISSRLLHAFRGQPHKMLLQFTDNRGRERHITVPSYACAPKEGERIRLLFDCDNPDDYILLPRGYQIISSDICSGVIFTLIGAFWLIYSFLI